MKFSIIIPTINRVSDVESALSALSEQTFKDFEVLVIDQNEATILNSTIENFKSLLDLKHFRIKAKGASNARNIGIDNSTGEIVTFPDDDCEYPSGFLERISNIFEENKMHDGIVVNTIDKNDNKQIARLSKNTIDIKRSNILKSVIEAGIFVKHESLGDIRFDEMLGVGSLYPYWSDEGPDFVLRLLERNKSFVFFPDIRMYHPNPIKVYNENTTKRAFDYGMGRGFFLKKNNFGIFSLMKYLGMYIIGMAIGLLKFNNGMFKYFKYGFKGRLKGYFSY